MSTEEVLVYTRLAADKVGATKMDRPEDVEPSPRTGKVYVALTNNSNRGGAEQAPARRGEPAHGQPRRPRRRAHRDRTAQAGETFGWSILLLCGDPSTNAGTYFAGFPKEQVSPISCPDNVAFDSEGNLWISTDGAPARSATTTGCSRCRSRATERGHVQQFLSVPREAETCGPVIHDRDGLVFVAVQHPGENGSVGGPALVLPRLRPGARRGHCGGAAALRRAGVPGVGRAGTNTGG